MRWSSWPTLRPTRPPSRRAREAEETKGWGARMAARREKSELDLKVRTLNALMRSMATFDGKRVLLLATHRLSAIAGAEYFWAEGMNAELDSLDRIELDTRNIMKSLYDTANANSVATYPLFPEGLSAPPNVSAAGRYPAGDVGMSELRGSFTSNPTIFPTPTSSKTYEYLIQGNETPVLQEVAKQTGGLAAWGSSDVTRLLDVVRDDFDTYYSLAYRATPRSVDKARSVMVKTRRPDLVVRSRRQVIEKSDTRRMKDRVVAGLFHTDDPGARLKFAVKFGNRERRGRKFRIPVSIRIPVSALMAVPNGTNYSGAFGVYVAWEAKIGGVSDATQQRRSFEIPAADLERARRSYFTYDFEIAVDARTERLAVGVTDEGSKEYGVKVIDIAALPRAAAVPARR